MEAEHSFTKISRERAESFLTAHLRKDSCRVSRALITVMVAVLFTASGCMIPRHRGVINETPPPLAMRVTKYFPTALYTLSPGDVLEFLYLTSPGLIRGRYKLKVKDQIDVEFTYHPQLNRTVRVRPDGMISIPRKPDVLVAGLTADQVRERLTRLYADWLRDPEITITVREFNAKLDEMQKAIATAPYGQARIVTVRPDGGISLPLIPNMQAGGITVPELTRVVNKKYSGILPDMTVSVLLREVVGNLVFIDGEVAKPGPFNTKGPISVQQLIAQAGGTKETAEPRTVLVVSRMPDGRFFSRTIDLTNMTSGSDFMLRRNDLVYVPRSTIARADIWVDQNIRRLLLFTGWTLGLQTDLGRTTVR